MLKIELQDSKFIRFLSHPLLKGVRERVTMETNYPFCYTIGKLAVFYVQCHSRRFVFQRHNQKLRQKQNRKVRSQLLQHKTPDFVVT